MSTSPYDWPSYDSKSIEQYKKAVKYLIYIQHGREGWKWMERGRAGQRESWTEGERGREKPEERSCLLSSHMIILTPITVARGLGYADWMALGCLGN